MNDTSPEIAELVRQKRSEPFRFRTLCHADVRCRTSGRPCFAANRTCAAGIKTPTLSTALRDGRAILNTNEYASHVTTVSLGAVTDADLKL
ncbi:MAG: hypothetical protein ABIR24_05690 [Verrucomicrobiota bacterium]